LKFFFLQGSGSFAPFELDSYYWVHPIVFPFPGKTL